MHLGATPFSIYNTYTEEQIEHLLQDSGSRVVITEQAHADKILAVRDAVEGIEQVVVVDGEPPAGTISLDELAAGGAADFDFEAAWRAVEPDDVLTLIYTSGTTGPPKGVQITHANICETVRSYDELIQFPDGGRIVSYLPMAHVAERNVSHYLPMLCGFTITCCPDAREVMAYLPEVRPTWFFAVPRIWEKLKAGLEQMLAAAPAEQRAATQAALAAALEKVRLEQSGRTGPRRAGGAGRKGRRGDLREAPRAPGPRPGGGLQRGRRPDPAGGDRVLPRPRHPAVRALGDVGDDGRRHLQPTRADQDRHHRAARARGRDQARRGRRDHDQGPGGDEGLPEPAREDRRDLHRGRLPAHRRHRRVRRGRIPADRRSKEGADHHRPGQEPLARQHRGAAEADSRWSARRSRSATAASTSARC